ncbi:MAG: hypothetical protein PUD83_06770 [Bacteroidales bacterium]|nr:hypothetical protein [Bacteroidales bacterium]
MPQCLPLPSESSSASLGSCQEEPGEWTALEHAMPMSMVFS